MTSPEFRPDLLHAAHIWTYRMGGTGIPRGPSGSAGGSERRDPAGTGEIPHIAASGAVARKP